MSSPVKLKVIAVVAVMCMAIVGMLFVVGAAANQTQNDTQVKTTEEMAKDIDKVFESAGSAVSSIAVMDEIIAQAQDPTNPDNPQALSVLKTVKAISGAHMVYVMGDDGTVIACSPFGDNETITGNNYVYRPYFKASLNGTEFLYSAVGATTGHRGIFHSYPIRAQAGQAPIGVIIIKMYLDEVDAITSTGQSLLLSPDGIVFSASNPDWLYKSALPITDEGLETIRDSQQFGNENLTPLGATLDKETVTLDGKEYSVVRTPLAIEGWSIVTLEEAPPYPVESAAMNAVIIGVIGILVILILVLSSRKKEPLEDNI